LELGSVIVVAGVEDGVKGDVDFIQDGMIDIGGIQRSSSVGGEGALDARHAEGDVESGGNRIVGISNFDCGDWLDGSWFLGMVDVTLGLWFRLL
jgi:hypothetical protein